MSEQPAAEWVDPATLTPWERDPRLDDHAVGPVADSISRFGFGELDAPRIGVL